MTKSPDVAIVGAGPYGLSVAAHLRAQGVSFRIFGEPMSSWLSMPTGMNLKSLGFATSIGVPQAGYDFPSYLAARGLETLEPCSYKDFAEYGLWVQKQLIPEVEPVNVDSVSSAGSGFELRLATGERVRAPQAVIAIGLGPFQRLPPVFDGLPSSLVTHTFGQSDFAQWAGKDVAVVGIGQSALEAATLLHERGARTVVISRSKTPYFYQQMAPNRSLFERIRNPLTVLGTGRRNWFLEKFPFAMHRAKDERRVHMARTYLGPSGAWWLRERFEGKVPVQAQTGIERARAEGGRIVLTLHEAGKPAKDVTFDHVVCGSGFLHDLDKLTFVDEALRGRIARVERAPRLTRQFESSSVPGLYFVGPISAYSFGPLFRFVCGDEPTAPVVARRIASQRRSMASSSAAMDAPVAGRSSGATAR